MAVALLSWAEFAARAPELAESGRRLLFQYGPGLAFLATVRQDGAPRLHPICPTVLNGRLFALIGPSPKRGDLLRDGRYALHAFLGEQTDDEFYLAGRAERLHDATLRQAVFAALTATGVMPTADDELFEFRIERALHSAYAHRGQWPPARTIWPPRTD
ncbi:MAG TPA: hypothetical protein VFD32_01190 [Dehalococcoidia bacterium]|nr:hypothetical protein [Dehalococcoidia bacterium]